jgi:amino acid adenylation domain-containing protein
VETLLDEFARRVAEAPDRLALQEGTRALTYGELNSAANRIANALVERRGDGQEPVGVYLGHSANAIVALLGVTKAGQIRLALDPHAPPDRLREILRHAGAGVVLTDRANRDVLGDLGDIEALELEGLDDHREGDPAVDIPDGAVLGLIYTSGSTGRPKAIVVGHAEAVAAARMLTAHMGTTVDERFSVTAGLSFAASRGFDRMLMVGASVHVFDLTTLGPARLAQWLAESRATYFVGVASSLRALIDELPEGGSLPDLKWVVSGGEPVYRQDVERLRARVGPQCVFSYGYALTESWLGTQYVVDGETALADGPVPSGKPLPGVDLWLEGVDEEGRGEIVLRSPYVAGSYWREPELSAATFTADPADASRRSVRSGDLGRLGPDGNLEVVGRLDDQVKIRGYLVAPSEVQAALVEQPEVAKAAVLLATRARGDSRLVAYYEASDPAAPPTVNSLRRALLTKLPPYMAPAAFVAVESLPITRSGKVDRRALAGWPSARPLLDDAYVAPRDELEQKLVDIWEQLLDISPIGVDDDFYALGGDSLTALEAKVATGERLGLELPLLLFAESTATVARIAEALRAPARAFEPLVALQPDGLAPPFFCAGGVTGEILELSPLAAFLSPDHPLYGLQVVGAKGDRAIRSIPALARHYIELIRTVTTDPFVVGGYSGGGIVAYEMAQQLAEAGSPPAAVVLLDTPAPAITPATANGEPARNGARRDRRWKKRMLRLVLDAHVVSRRPVPPRWHDVYRTTQGFRALRAYRPRPYPGPVVLLQSRASGSPSGLGWEPLALGGLQVVSVPGGHHSMLMPPHVNAVGAALLSVLPLEARPGSAPPT